MAEESGTPQRVENGECAEGGSVEEAANGDAPATSSGTVATVDACAKAVPISEVDGDLKNRLLTFLTLSVSDSVHFSKTLELAKQKTHQFWESQPVPKFDEVVSGDVNQALVPSEQVKEVRRTPYSLPPGFEWSEIDSNCDTDMTEIYQLLTENYVEDDENMFRFDYSIPFLQWALKPPGWNPDWFIGMRVSKTKKLVGFISAVPATIRVFDKPIKMVEINFLCVHKKLREKRMAPVLIREITRRVNLKHIYQAVYTAGVLLPKPIGCCRYWHRSLNPKKLVEAKFSHLGRNMTLQRAVKLYKLPKETRTVGLRRMMPKDAEQLHRILDDYLKKFDLAPVFSLDEFVHWFTSRDEVIDSYVVENDGQLTDFFSYYTLASSVMHHPVHKSIRAAYLFYCVANVTPITSLMTDALIIAKNAGYDVFNALDLMENSSFLEELKFGVGDGHLQYYLYNWKCPEVRPDKIGLILH